LVRACRAGYVYLVGVPVLSRSYGMGRPVTRWGRWHGFGLGVPDDR